MLNQSPVRAVVRWVAVVSGVFLVPVARAQVTLTPYVGSYYAASSIVPKSSGFTVDQTNTATFGARLTLPIGPVMALEGTFAFASSDIAFVVPDACVDQSPTPNVWDCSTNLKGSLILGSARVRFRPRRSNLYFLVGGAYAKHGGKAWDDPLTSDLSDIGAVVGFGLRASITPQVPLNIGAEAYIYSFDPDGSGTVFSAQTQSDLLFTIGIPISLSR